jgi:hypothetical protein
MSGKKTPVGKKGSGPHDVKVPQTTDHDRNLVIRTLRQQALHGISRTKLVTKVGGETSLDMKEHIRRHEGDLEQGEEPLTKTIIQIPTISLLDITQSYTSYVLMGVFAIIFVALVVFIVYDLSVHTHSHLSFNQKAEPDHSEMAHSGLKKSTKQLHNRMMVKVLHAEEIWDHYKHLSDDRRLVHSGTTVLFYNIYDLNDELTHGRTGESAVCDPIISSVELSCCCFAEKLDQTICHGDDPSQIATSTLPHDVQIKVFQVSCDLFHFGQKPDGEKTKHLSVYLGLSGDYINQTLPQYTNGFTSDNHNECTLKMKFMCVMAMTMAESP